MLDVWVRNYSTIFEQNKALPARVVIHKLTPFRKDEIEGLTLGLQNIKNIDLIEINIDNNLKFIASSRKTLKLKLIITQWKEVLY